MKLEVGMYVRTEYSIFKYLGIDEEGIYRRTLKSDDKNITTGFDIDRVLKASYDIMDILEIGDFVNGCKVHNIANCLTIILDNEENISWINPSDIKTIVTKEQFEYMEYRIGE